MEQKVKHFSLHRINGTELRVVSSVEDGVLPVIEVEEKVIREYIQRGLWQHKWMTLFILQDLESLVRHLHGAADVLANQPLVNVYDLADLSGCQIFINEEVMVQEGYWSDSESLRALLGHEHAHAISECPTTRASRMIEFQPTAQGNKSPASGSCDAIDPAAGGPSSAWARCDEVLNLLAQKLCVYAPREILANDVTIRSGFDGAMMHLERLNLAKARSGVAGREGLKTNLEREVEMGNLESSSARRLLLLGDLQSYLELAIDIAPFYRNGRESSARELEALLEDGIFPHIEPEAIRTYHALVQHYITLRDYFTELDMLMWARNVLRILEQALAAEGLVFHRSLEIAA